MRFLNHGGMIAHRKSARYLQFWYTNVRKLCWRKGEDYVIPDYLRREISVLFFIINKEQTTTKEIAESLQLTPRKVRDTLTIINKHFEEFHSISSFILIKNSGMIKINSEFKEHSVSSAYSLKLQLLKNNATFNYTVLLLTRSSLNKDHILNELFISPSYLNILTQKLNEFFSSFDFRITVREGYYTLVGDEMNIRLFSYLYLQDSFHDLEWPFQDISLHSIRASVPEEILEESYKRSFTKNRSLYILYAILQTRIHSNHRLVQPESLLTRTLFTIIFESFDAAVIFQKNSFGSLDDSTKNNEILYFNFLSHLFISDIIPIEEKIKLGKTFFESDHSYCTFSRDVLAASSVLINDKLSDQNRHLVLYYLTLFNAFYFLVGDTIDCFAQLFIPPLSFRSNVQNDYMNVIKKTVSIYTKDENHTKYLSSLLYTLHTANIKTEVTIYLQLVKDYSASFYIENSLMNFFNKEHINITDNYEIADIVVTDTLVRSDSKKKVFYLNSIENDGRWDELLFLIQRVYLEKQHIQKEKFSL